MMNLVGREPEKERLKKLLNSNSAEFLAIYGRRRVGKTFLIREYYKNNICFELTGIIDTTLQDQLQNFHQILCKVSRRKLQEPTSWLEAFQLLENYLTKLSKKKKHVIFLDELPWLASARSKFLPALDHFWNSFLSRHTHLTLIVCGSAASWMISNVINSKGGLHNRVTARMKLQPFNLAEVSTYLKSRKIQLTQYDQLTLAIAMGGIPHYLKECERGKSVAQIIDNTAFRDSGLLADEFNRLYHSLFENADRHVDIVRFLAKHPQGLCRNDISKTYPSGGRLTKTLNELSEAGFITALTPFAKKTRDTIYKLTDEYSLFYLKWIAPNRTSGKDIFIKKMASPAWRSWSGYALESLALKHIEQIKKALGISQVETQHCSWIHRANKTHPNGAQIDLLIDREDNSINLVEIKFSQAPFTITKSYAVDLRNKIEVFKTTTKTKKNVFFTFLTSHGLTENQYSKEIVSNSITTECLFTQL